MSSLAAWELQEALVGALAAAGVTTPVYDEIPQTSAFPYVVVGDAFGTRLDTHDRLGEDLLCTVQVFSRYAGFKEALAVADAVNAALDLRPLTLSTHDLLVLRREDVSTLRDADGDTRRVVLRYRAQLQHVRGD